MRLNPDCIRDILLALEEHTGNREIIISIRDKDELNLSKYTDDEIEYHLRQCNLSGLFYRYSRQLGGNHRIGDLSPEAHEFLANIRENHNWNKTKEYAKKIGSFSIKALIEIASNVALGAIKNSLY